MTLPSSYFPDTDLPDIQDIAEVLDLNGAFTKKSTAILTSTYATGTVTATATGLFTTWNDFGYVKNDNTGELMFYQNKTNDTIDLVARGLSGTTETAGSVSDVLQYIEARILGLTVNQILSEIKAMQDSLSLIIALTVTAAISTDNSGKIHSNVGATGATSTRIATLPSINTYNQKLRYPIVIENSNGLRIKADTVDYIRIEGRQSVIGGYIESVDPGASILLIPVSQNHWVGIFRGGEWNVDGVV